MFNGHRIIGLVGGIGSGKTFVSEALKRFGACTISGDQIAHEVLKLDVIKSQILSRWVYQTEKCHVFKILTGPDYNEIDRSKVAKIVFNDPEELAFLEDIMSPLIWDRILGTLKSLHPNYIPAVVLDVPLLFKRNRNVICNEVWYVHADKQKRVSRYAQRTLKSLEVAEEELTRREYYMTEGTDLESYFRERADHVVDNNEITLGSVVTMNPPPSLEGRTTQLWEDFLAKTPGNQGGTSDVGRCRCRTDE